MELLRNNPKAMNLERSATSLYRVDEVTLKSQDTPPDNLIGDTKDNMAELACDGQIACAATDLEFSQKLAVKFTRSSCAFHA